MSALSPTHKSINEIEASCGIVGFTSKRTGFVNTGRLVAIRGLGPPIARLEGLSRDRLFPVFHQKLAHCDGNLLQVSWCFSAKSQAVPKVGRRAGESEDEIIFSCVGNVVGNIAYWRRILLIFKG